MGFQAEFHPLALALIGMATAAACAPETPRADDDDGDPSGSSSSSGAGAPTCVGRGFAEAPVDWRLPNYGTDPDGDALFEELGDERSCADQGNLHYQLVDLRGDGTPDMVVTRHCASDPAVGATTWRLHDNHGAGFEAEAQPWRLPDYGSDDTGEPALARTGDVVTCPDQGRLRYQILDLDGDARPDLVVSENCGADTATGQTHWRVHLNDGAGFAAEPVSWRMPSYGFDRNGDRMFVEIAADRSCPDEGRLRYQVLDLDGDARPDLVVSDNCLADPSAGEVLWRVHLNDGAGFASEPVLWRLPNYGTTAQGTAIFERVADEASCPDGGRIGHQLVDLDGDGRPDLVVTENCNADPNTGLATWRVHLNDGGGFAPEPLLWALPDYRIDAQGPAVFGRISNETTCPDEGRFHHQLLSLDGDGRPDLVVTSHCASDLSTGRRQWLVHSNQGDGFASEATVWTLPDYGQLSTGEGSLTSAQDRSSCADQGQLRHQVVGLSRAGLLDLVVSQNCASDPGTGRTQWRVHPTRCD